MILIIKVLREVLFHGGFEGDHLMETANTAKVKEQLKVNTKRCGDHVVHDNNPLHHVYCRAVDNGLCGVPSFQVNDDRTIIWGQDRLNVVADMLCNRIVSNSKL